MIRVCAVVLALLVGLALAAPALPSEERPTLEELENEVNCPTCKTTLALSNAPVADRIRAFISERIAAGDTKSEIKTALVGSSGRASWPRRRRKDSTCSPGCYRLRGSRAPRRWSAGWPGARQGRAACVAQRRAIRR